MLSMVVGGKYYIWLPFTFLFGNIFFFSVGLWTMQDKESILPVAMVTLPPSKIILC